MRNGIYQCRLVQGFALSLGLILMLGGALPTQAQTEPGDAALAARLTELGQNTTRSQTIVDATFKVAATLFEAAGRLDPTEPRYPRLQADAWIQAREPEMAVKALRAYLALRPDDRFAQIQFAEMLASRIETLDKRLTYLKDKVADDRVPPDVRSHLAFRAAQVSMDRSDVDDMKLLIDAAIKLNPLNLEALRARYQMIATSGTALERIATLLAMLKSNPNQLEAVRRLSQELATVGLVQPSTTFYGLCLNLSAREGRGVNREDAIAYGSELYLQGQAPMTKQIVDQLLPSNFADQEMAMLRLLAERAGDTKEFTEKSVQQAQNAFVNRLQIVRKVMGDASATTRPVELAGPVEFGDFGNDVRKLKEGIKPVAPDVGQEPPTVDQVTQAYIGVLTDLAWFQVYYLSKPDDAKPAIDALKQMLGDQAPAVVRLQGWSFLVGGHADEARVKLSAVADADPFARLGVIKLVTNQAAAKADGEKLLLEHAAGLTAVTIVDALREAKVTLNPPSERVATINEQLNQFPLAWLQVLDRPQNFYTVQVEPLKVAHPFGEPIIVRVIVQNVSDYPITVGPEGVIHRDLWFDAQFRGVVQQAFAGTAIDQLGGPLVLAPGASISQDVRVDQGTLSQTLQSSPFPSLQVVVQLRTNPSGTNSVGTCGQVVNTTRNIERTGFSLDRFPTLITQMSTGGNGDKIRAMDLAGTIAGVLAQQAKNEQFKKAAQQIAEALRTAQRDPSPSVAAWAGAVLAFRIAEPERPPIIQRLINDPNWQSRLVGLAVTGILPPDLQRAIAKQVSERDTDPLVRRYSLVLLELSDALQKAATQPTSQPSTVPATAPAPVPAAP